MINRNNQRYQKTILASTLVLALFAASCSAGQEPKDKEKKRPIVVDKNQPTAVGDVTANNRGLKKERKKMTREEQILFARQDLATKLKLELEEVQLSGAINVTWRSGALGCPKPGTQYTQALVPGVLIMVKVGNTAHRYHAIPRGEPFQCPDSLAEPPYVNSGDA